MAVERRPSPLGALRIYGLACEGSSAISLSKVNLKLIFMTIKFVLFISPRTIWKKECLLDFMAQYEIIPFAPPSG